MVYYPYNLKDVYNAAEQNKFTVISTFAGGGGSSTGYKLSGGNILAVNEFIAEARTTYGENYPSTPIIPDDIKDISGQDILDVAGIGVGELDILDGSPPCSAFSVAGKLSHSTDGKHSDGWGQTKNYSDGKWLRTLKIYFLSSCVLQKISNLKLLLQRMSLV